MLSRALRIRLCPEIFREDLRRFSNIHMIDKYKNNKINSHFDFVHIHRALELDINLRGIWKNHVTQLIREVEEKYFSSSFF